MRIFRHNTSMFFAIRLLVFRVLGRHMCIFRTKQLGDKPEELTRCVFLPRAGLVGVGALVVTSQDTNITSTGSTDDAEKAGPKVSCPRFSFPVLRSESTRQRSTEYFS